MTFVGALFSSCVLLCPAPYWLPQCRVAIASPRWSGCLAMLLSYLGWRCGQRLEGHGWASSFRRALARHLSLARPECVSGGKVEWRMRGRWEHSELMWGQSANPREKTQSCAGFVPDSFAERRKLLQFLQVTNSLPGTPGTQLVQLVSTCNHMCSHGAKSVRENIRNHRRQNSNTLKHILRKLSRLGNDVACGRNYWTGRVWNLCGHQSTCHIAPTWCLVASSKMAYSGFVFGVLMHSYTFYHILKPHKALFIPSPQPVVNFDENRCGWWLTWLTVHYHCQICHWFEVGVLSAKWSSGWTCAAHFAARRPRPVPGTLPAGEAAGASHAPPGGSLSGLPVAEIRWDTTVVWHDYNMN